MTQKHSKSSTLVDCPSVGTHRIQRNDASRILVVDSYGITFSSLQYRALVLLVQGGVIAEQDLIRAIYGHEIGHMVGLAHNKGCVLMNPTTFGPGSRWQGCGINTPLSDDINGVNAQY